MFVYLQVVASDLIAIYLSLLSSQSLMQQMLMLLLRQL